MRRIGILKADHIRDDWGERFGQYSDMVQAMLEQAGAHFDYAVYDVQAGQFPEEVDDCDGWLVTGSRCDAFADDPWIVELRALLRDIAAERKPLAGICFGHQVIAQALGGRVERAPAGWGLGVRRTALVPEAAAATGLATDMDLLYSHQDQVTSVPPGARVLASSAFCSIAAFALGEHVLGLQGHPEFSADYLRELTAVRRSGYPPEVYAAAVASLEQPTHSAQVGRWLADFLARGDG